jgi:hypothetical protein
MHGNKSKWIVPSGSSVYDEMPPAEWIYSIFRTFSESGETMKLRSFSNTGLWRGRHWYTFKRIRKQSPTECYEIYIEDSDGYILVSKSTLETSIPKQVIEIVDWTRKEGYTIHSVFSESGERYPI